MAAPRLLLGVDGGNTKSIALVAGPDGTILGAGRTEGSSDIYAEPVDEAIARIEQAIEQGLHAAGAADATVAAAVFSLAGADWPEDFQLLGRRLGRSWRRRRVVNDAVGALRAAVPTGPGVVVVCGTGAATAARGADGETWHASFWQEPQGAHELGVRTLHALSRAELGIDPPTGLAPAVLAALGEPDVEAVLHRFTGRATRSSRELAALAGVLLDLAEAGDPTAMAIVERHGAALGAMALAAARRVGIHRDPFTLAVTGGVLRHPGTRLVRAIVRTVLRQAPATTVVRPSLEPAAGALLLAFDLAGIAVTEAIEERLRTTLPPRRLFETRGLPAAAAP